MLVLLLLILLGVALVAVAVLFLARRRSAERLGQAESEREDLRRRLGVLEPYQAIVNAEAHAATVLAQAKSISDGVAQQAQDSARELVAQAQRFADDLVGQARAQAAEVVTSAAAQAETLDKQARESTQRAAVHAETLSKQAQADVQRAAAEAAQLRGAAEQDAREKAARAKFLVAQATDEANRVVEAAKKRAEEIAGDAYRALQDARELEATVKAMKNVIEGYGDQYLVPTFSLLDELAEEFGYAEAGGRLKAARQRARDMIKAGAAATCDYVEEYRREQALRFVLDAFNGKVETILAEVADENFGTLEQQMKDAYRLVNLNGQAFRNARIVPLFLEARLDELRWVCTVQALKVKEREEQRAIKDRIREEEKAQREFERARKEAEKEEDYIRKAMEKAQREIERAGTEQKAKYEAQLQELAEKLQVAEEKNKRALSMAQQTRAGHVYVISNVGSFGENVYKIGMTRRLVPDERVRELGDASVPFEFDIHAMIRSEDAPTLERELHRRFLHEQMNKVNPRKEFFRVTLHVIREAVEKLGCAATWTIAAQCREYKETLAIESAMKEHRFEEKSWAEKQLKEHDLVVAEAVEREAVA